MKVVYYPKWDIAYSPPVYLAMRERLLFNQSLPEKWMQQALDLSGVSYERQAIVIMEYVGWCLRPMFLDFYIPNRLVAVEVDGSHHRTVDQQRADAHKNSWCLEMGVRLIRVRSHRGSAANIAEMHKWSALLANPNFVFHGMQLGSGF